MNICDNLGDHLVGNVYVKVSLLKLFLNNEMICSFNKGLSGKYIFLDIVYVHI